MNNKQKAIAAVVAIIIIAAIAIAVVSFKEEQQPITEIYIPGHGDQIYTFSNDIRQSLLVRTNDLTGINMIGQTMTTLGIVFDGSNQQDNAYFRVVLTDLAAKIPIYYSYQGKLVTFDVYYYMGDTWYNSTSQAIERPNFTEPVVWMKGPSTGANDTSLILQDNIIYLSGTSYKNLTMAGDKLTLTFFGIDKI